MQAFCTYVHGAGCGANPTEGVAALMSMLIASFLYLCAGCGTSQDGEDGAPWPTPGAGVGVWLGTRPGGGAASHILACLQHHNSFDLHIFMSRISSQTCVSLDDLTYMYHKKIIKNQ
jgi:hypothetical protein